MIKPKHTFQKPGSLLFNEKLFVDRESARRVFKDFILGPCKEYNVLMYYGIGGIGKSRLMAENIVCFKNTFLKNLCFSVDFNDIHKRTIGETLEEFVDGCSVKECSFVAFNLAYAIYFSKKHSREEYSEDKNTISDKLKTFFDILGIWDSGRIKVAIDIISKIIDYARIQALDNEILRDLEELQNLSLNEIEQRLPSYFQYDLCRYLSKHNDVHVLFTIDTFEALNVKQTEDIHRRRNEDWVQDLIAHFSSEVIPYCYFVLCGRDQLRWEEDWDPYITQFELEDFSNEWADSYLVQVGVNEADIRESIIKGSRCLPFYLYLSAKTYVDIRNKGNQPKIEDFGTSQKQIIQRFIYNLSDDEVRTLKYLAVPNYFTHQIFVHILSHLNIACDPERFEQIIAYSFIQESINNKYYIHALMRDGLLVNTSEYSKQEVNALMFDFYEKQYETSKDKYSYTEMMFHASSLKDISEFRIWFKQKGYNEYLKTLQLRGEQVAVLSITENLIRIYGIPALSRETINIYIDVLHLGGDYEAAVKTSSEYLASFSTDEIIDDEGLFRMRIRQVHNSMFYIPVNILMSETEALLHTTKINEYPDQYAELMFLLGGNLGVLSGDIAFAEKLINQALIHAQEGQRKDFILRNIRKLADIDTFKGNVDLAINRITNFLTLDSQINKRYEIYLLASLGEAYRKKGAHDLARRCYEIVGAKSQERNLSGWVGHANLALAILAFQQKQYNEAKSILVEVIKRYSSIRHVWGEVNAKTLLLLCESQLGQSSVNVIELKDIAYNMGYRYNVSILEQFIKNGVIDYFQLFFL